MDLRGATQIIKAFAPLSEMLGYASGLRLRTEGRATCSMHFERYEPRPGEPDDDEDRIAFVAVPRTPAPKGKDSGVALSEPHNG